MIKFENKKSVQSEAAELVPLLFTGVTLEKAGTVRALCGTKTLIESDEILTIPENYDYNTFTLENDGIIENNGQINFI